MWEGTGAVREKPGLQRSAEARGGTELMPERFSLHGHMLWLRLGPRTSSG